MQSSIAPMARDMKTTENPRIFGSFSLINHILECGSPSLLHTVGNACPKIHEVDFIRECRLHHEVTSSENADFIAE